jgi:hypothetical protein
MSVAAGPPRGESDSSSGKARGFVVTMHGVQGEVDSVAGEILVFRPVPPAPGAVDICEARRAA